MPDNVWVQPAVRKLASKTNTLFTARLHPIGTPGMAINLWGASLLYEDESLKEGSIPTVTPIVKVLMACNCVRATDRGKEATSQSCDLERAWHQIKRNRGAPEPDGITIKE